MVTGYLVQHVLQTYHMKDRKENKANRIDGVSSQDDPLESVLYL